MDSISVTDLPPAVMTREEARAAGLKFYNPGEPCLYGHNALRSVANNSCKECRVLRKKKYNQYGERCSIEGCPKPRDTNGFCPSHYQRWKKHGDPLAGGPQNGDGLKWLASHSDYNGDDCLIWPFGKGRSDKKNGKRGYGLTYVDGQVVGAHVVMCRIAHGEKPAEADLVAHSCNRGEDGCVNPRHLRWATHQENTMDRHEHGTMMTGEDHHNAKLTAENVKQIKALKGIVSERQLAKMFNVSRGSISAVLRGITWGHTE